MPNYYRTLYNRTIDNAAELYRLLSGGEPNGGENRLPDIADKCIEIDGMQFVRILRYRRTQSPEANFELIRQAMKANLSYCFHQRSAFGYFLVSCGGECRVYIGMEGLPADRLVELTAASIPDIAFDPGFVSGRELQSLTRYGGLMHGDVECGGPMLDRFFSALQHISGTAALLAVPMDEAERMAYLGALSRLEQHTGRILNGGAQTDLPREKNCRYIPEIHALAHDRNAYFSDRSEDFWKTCIWFTSDRREHLDKLGNALAAALQSVNGGKSGMRVFYAADNPLRQGRLYLPALRYGSDFDFFSGALPKPAPLSCQSSSHLASMLQLPASSLNGLQVIEMDRDEQSLRLFDRSAQEPDGESIVLGQAEDGRAFFLRLEDLASHVLVTGATGAGKTNTVKTLIKGIHDAGVPTLIIEPSKKDYWLMAPELRDMQIYSFGLDAELLRLNPLMPEEGVVIGNHIDSLLYAFSGAFEMEEPTRLALDGLLKYSYKKYGWRADDIARADGRAYPMLRDLLDNLSEYCRTQLPYGEEVRNNILGSLYNRLSALSSGILGMALQSSRPVSGRELSSGTILIELDDLSLETKPFVAMLILIKLDQYLRQGDSSAKLRRVIVLEEAHNVFPDVSGQGTEKTGRQASRYFSNMLSQIRGYGAGFIIADQGPSQIHEMAVSNTKVKIIHAIVDGKDIDRISFSLKLSDVQKKAFPALQAGEAVVAVRGDNSVPRIAIRRYGQSPLRNTACMFCSRRTRCPRFNETDTVAIPRRLLYAQRILQMRYDAEGLRRELRTVADHLGWTDGPLCLLGCLLQDPGLKLGQREKRRLVMQLLKAGEEKA